jgi:uncharacterized protein YegJ (DUF2314 family)
MILRSFALVILLVLPPLGAPLRAAAEDGVLGFRPDDRAMLAAIDAARASLPDFLAIAATADLSTGAYSVKRRVPLADGGAEHIWVVLLRIDGDRLDGVYDNAPVYFDARPGDPVSFSPAEVSDWAYWDAEGLLNGSYTTRVMLPDLPPDEAAAWQAVLAPLPQAAP